MAVVRQWVDVAAGVKVVAESEQDSFYAIVGRWEVLLEQGSLIVRTVQFAPNREPILKVDA
jgi:hypothetical protein